MPGLRTLALAGSLVCACIAASIASGQSGCALTTIGPDTSLANSQDALFHGDAIGQTFVAPETLITSITVWRPAWFDTCYAGLNIYVMSADSLGHPNQSDVFQHGPTVYNFYGDGVHPIPHKFVFDPPISLPTRGRYHFAIQTEPCDATVFFCRNNANAYSEGGTWWYAQSFSSPCHLRPNPVDNGLVDLIFEVEFCQSGTASRPATWGQLKAGYR